jgi:hypothetical protein
MKVWFNLHRRDWSTRASSKDRVQHTAAVRLLGAVCHVNEAERLRVVARRCRSVHAWITGEAAEPIAEPRGVLVSYNPYRGGTFYRKDTGEPVTAAAVLHFLPDGRVLGEGLR